MNWRLVAVSCVWIAGLAVLLAALSHLDWTAERTGQPRVALMRAAPWRVALAASLFLSVLGALLALTLL